MKRIVSFIACLFISICMTVNAQTITGKVINRNNEPIEFATVILQTPDSLYVNSTSTDSTGRFSLSAGITAYHIIVQHLIYETYEKNYSNEFDLTIQLTEKENMLNEIVVKREKPIVRLVDGKITYDMPLLLSGKAVSNAYESLLQLPGVREQNGSLVLAGASKVTVIINGQVTSMPVENLMSVLKMYPANLIQSAEIMYSAPPQYHVRGAVINLVLKGNDSSNSLEGQLNLAYTQKHYANYTTGISLLSPASKLTADFNYAYNRNQTWSGMDIYSNHLYNDIVNHIEQFNKGNRKSGDHHIRLGLDYKLTKTDGIDLAYTSQITDNSNNNEWSDGTFSRSINHKENKSPEQMHDILLNYSSGFGLKAGAEYTLYKDYTNQHFTEQMPGKENEFTTDAEQKINRYRFFADQSHSLASQWTLNYGAQYMYANDNSSQIYRSLADYDMSGLDVAGKLAEYTANAYIGFEKKFADKLSISASITGEYYKLGDFDEWTAFPTFEMTYFVSLSKILQLSFSSDKIYPAYWEMHGAISYLNGYSEIHGNPLLKPYRDYSTQLNYILNSKYVLTAFFNYQDRYFVQLPYQAPDQLILIYETLNFDYKQSTGLNLIIPFNIQQVLNTRLTLIGFYDKVKSSRFHDISFTNDHLCFYARLNNTIHISSKPNITMEINGAYVSKSIQGPADLTSLWNLDAGLKWTFFHDRAELRLRGSDLFNSWSPDLNMKYNTQDLRMNIIPDSRAISLSFTFKLGGYDKTYKEFDSSRFGTK